MNLSDKWRVRSDAYQFILERLTTTTKRDKVTKKLTDETVEEWQVHGFYPSVDQLARAITTTVARESVEAAETFSDFHEVFKYAVGIVRLELGVPEEAPA